MDRLKIEMSDNGLSLIEFVKKTKEGLFSGSDNIPDEYIVRYDIPDATDVLNVNEPIEQYHFGLIG